MTLTGSNRITIDAARGNLESPAALNRVIPTDQQWPGGHKGLHQEEQESATHGQTRPDRALEHTVIVHKMRLVTQARHAQDRGYGALAAGQNRAGP